MLRALAPRGGFFVRSTKSVLTVQSVQILPVSTRCGSMVLWSVPLGSFVPVPGFSIQHKSSMTLIFSAVALCSSASTPPDPPERLDSRGRSLDSSACAQEVASARPASVPGIACGKHGHSSFSLHPDQSGCPRSKWGRAHRCCQDCSQPCSPVDPERRSELVPASSGCRQDAARSGGATDLVSAQSQ